MSRAPGAAIGEAREEAPARDAARLSFSRRVTGPVASARNVWAVFAKELVSFFLSPVAYVILFLFVLTNGWLFFHYVTGFAGDPQQIPLTIRSLFGFSLFWTLLLSPLLTMRLLAEEKRTGTLEMLLTAPITEAQVVTGKLAAAQVFYMLIWSTLLLFVGVLEVLGNPDWGPVLAIYAGLFFLGILTNAAGLFTSALTRNQLIAAIAAISINLFFLALRLGGWIFYDAPELQRLFHYLSFSMHFASEYTRGIVDLRYFGYYTVLGLFFAFWTVRLLESRKWR